MVYSESYGGAAYTDGGEVSFLDVSSLQTVLTRDEPYMLDVLTSRKLRKALAVDARK